MSVDQLVKAIPHWLYIGETSLHLAAAALRPEEAELLLQAGADPNAENRRGATPLHYCCDPRPRAGPWSREAQTKMIRLLVEHGADLDRPDRGGATPLHRAVRARSPGAVRQLVELGARLDSRLKKGGSSPLHLAVQSTGAEGTAGATNEQLEIIAILLQGGADQAVGDATGRTPHDWARSERILLALTGNAEQAARRRRRSRKTQQHLKESLVKKSDPRKRDSATRLIDARIKELGDWRGETLSRIRTSSSRPTPEWSRNGSGEESRCGLTTG